jgi:hypothetical protein
MPRYYFDIDDGEDSYVDNIGVDLPDMDAAIREARRALADMMRDALREAKSDGISVRIRDGAEGPVRLEVTLTTIRPEKPSR